MGKNMKKMQRLTTFDEHKLRNQSNHYWIVQDGMVTHPDKSKNKVYDQDEGTYWGILAPTGKTALSFGTLLKVPAQTMVDGNNSNFLMSDNNDSINTYIYGKNETLKKNCKKNRKKNHKK